MEDGKIEMAYCGKDHQDAVGDWWRCGEVEGACPSCLRVHIAKQDAAIEAAQAELATAREALLESLEAHQVTEAEGGALQQANTEIDRLRAELAALRGQRQAGHQALTLVDVIEAVGSVDDDKSWQAITDDLNAKVRKPPSSRVAGEGEVVVSAEEWVAMSAIGYDPEPCRHDHHGYCQEHGWFSLEPCPTGIMQRLRAANGKGEGA